MKRSENEIRAALQAAREAYRAAVAADAPASKVRALAQPIPGLMAELSAVIAQGAQPCARCHGAAHGMLLRDAVPDKAPARYEVGCLTPGCDERGKGWSPAEAVANYNRVQAELRDGAPAAGERFA